MTQEREQELLKSTTSALLKYAPKNTGWITWLTSMTGMTTEEIKTLNNPIIKKEKTLEDELTEICNFLNEKDGYYNWSANIRNNVIDIHWGGYRNTYFSIIKKQDKYIVYDNKGLMIKNLSYPELKKTIFNIFYYCTSLGGHEK